MRLCCLPALRGDGGKTEEADGCQGEAGDQDEREGQIGRIRKAKAERHCDIENIVANDIEIATKGRLFRCPRNRSVQPIKQTVEHDKRKAQRHVMVPNRPSRSCPNRHSHQACCIGTNAPLHRPPRHRRQGWINQRAKPRVKHQCHYGQFRAYVERQAWH